YVSQEDVGILEPKYWCKHCKTYVRDSKFERTQHEATPKHQGNLKRFLRDLHRGHEREERDKQRAKNEVERLNGVVTGSHGATSSSDPPWKRRSAITPVSSANKQVSVAERKQQLAQLAEMGVAIPEEFRRDMAMVGDWQTLSERVIEPSLKKEEGEDIKPEVHSIGVRKRKYLGEEEEEAAQTNVRKGWGSRIKAHPGQDDGNLDALLGVGQNLGRKTEAFPSRTTNSGTRNSPTGAATAPPTDTLDLGPNIKKEDSNEGSPAWTVALPESISIKTEDGQGGEEVSSEAPVIFKKRRTKNIRQV
ncbi:MAG: WW domain binding protein 4, partial [Candelina submexicana]